MTIQEQVLKLLEENKGSCLSGEAMAKKLFVSRNAVWKAVSRLRAAGYPIDAATNRGYRLAPYSNIFSAQSILAKLEAPLRERLSIRVIERTGSTNTDLKRAAEQGEKHGTVLIAKEQTNGKGRLGRSFCAPKDTGLYMSILLRPDFSAEEALFITTSAAVAVSEAADALAGTETKIKWVNDVYSEGKKICGILTEASMNFENGRLDYAVCGIGVNLTADTFPEELRSIAGGILSERKELRAELAAGILSRFFFYYDRLPAPDFLPEYRRRSLLLGKRIEFTQNGREFEGTAQDIDSKARLVVRLNSGETTALSSGEASLKKGEWIQ